jgi:hypothetical protein
MNAKKFFFYLLAVLLGGCVPILSLHPLFTEKDVVFDEKLLGTWVDDPNSPEATWEFKRADTNDNAYRLIFSDKEGKKGMFVAHLVKLKDKLFLDIYPAPWEQQDPNKVEWVYNTLFLIPAHTFIKVNSVEPQLKMQLTDDEKMAEFLKADPNAVKFDSLEDGPGKYLLTASTKELQAFVLKYADDSRVFTGLMVYSRKKTADPNAPVASKPGKTSK